MKMKNLFYIMLIIFLISSGCSQPEEKNKDSTGVKIALSADSTSVELQNIPSYAIAEFRADSLGNDQWKDFFAVYEEPSDKEMRDFQAAVDGTYFVLDSLVRFIPAEGFKKAQPYFSRCYTRELMQEPEDIIAKRDLSPTDSFLEFKFIIN